MGRVSAALGVQSSDLFLPLLPTIAVGLAGTFVIAWLLGNRERKRLGIVEAKFGIDGELFDRENGVARPKLFLLNVLLTLAVLGCAFTHVIPLPIAFMIALALALTINYPSLSQQRDRIAKHAENALPIAMLVLAAAVFTGVLNGTGMVDAMGQSLLALLPEQTGPYLGAMTAITSGPFTFIMSNDAYYFGVVPIIAETASHAGFSPEQIGRASLLGQTIHGLSPLVAAIYLAAGLLGVEVGDLQKFGLPFAIALYLLMIVTALITGAVPFYLTT